MRDEYSKDVKPGTVIKDKNGKLVTDGKEVLQLREEYVKTLLKQGKKRELDQPSVVEGELRVEEIGVDELEREKEREREREREREQRRRRMAGIDVCECE